ncbi:FAD-dependent oxidoreductase [Streptomyces albulus]|nr:FAD-dependent oxidoreductase [Streptomyces noursei]
MTTEGGPDGPPTALAHPVPDPQPTPLPDAADVVVVGGGVIGASIAFHLAEAAVGRVLLLERDLPASGSSGKPWAGSAPSSPTRSTSASAGAAWTPGGTSPVARAPTSPCTPSATSSSSATKPNGTPSPRASRSSTPTGCPAASSPRAPPGTCAYVDPRTLVAAAFSPTDGYATPKAAVTGYLRAARRLGATVRTRCPVTAIDTADGHLTAVRTRTAPSAPPP